MFFFFSFFSYCCRSNFLIKTLFLSFFFFFFFFRTSKFVNFVKLLSFLLPPPSCSFVLESSPLRYILLYHLFSLLFCCVHSQVLSQKILKIPSFVTHLIPFFFFFFFFSFLFSFLLFVFFSRVFCFMVLLELEKLFLPGLWLPT